MGCKLISAFGHEAEIAALFGAYTEMLIAGEPAFRDYLAQQNYDAELAHLEEKYGAPDGRLYLAYCGEEAAGCIGLRRLNETDCEMKRLYVKPQFRGEKIGAVLVQRIIADAREIGYRRMRLDTFPFLESAVRLYRAHGFYEIERYNDSEIDTLLYLQLDL